MQASEVDCLMPLINLYPGSVLLSVGRSSLKISEQYTGFKEAMMHLLPGIASKSAVHGCSLVGIQTLARYAPQQTAHLTLKGKLAFWSFLFFNIHVLNADV